MAYDPANSERLHLLPPSGTRHEDSLCPQMFGFLMAAIHRCYPRWTREKVFDFMGEVITNLAMWPQGGLGAALADEYWLKDLPLPLRIALDIFFAYSAAVGKEKIVRFFNKGDFIKLASVEWRKINPLNFTVLDGLKAGFVIPPAMTFAGLVAMSLNLTAEILNDYRQPWADDVAVVIQHAGFQIPFMLAAFIANLLSFPNIGRGAIAKIWSLLNVFLENPDYRALTREHRNEIEVVRVHLKTLLKTERLDPSPTYEGYKRALHLMMTGADSVAVTASAGGVGAINDDASLLPEITAAAITSEMVRTYYRHNQETLSSIDIKQESTLYWMTKFLLASAGVGATVVGLGNFYEIGGQAATAVSDTTGIPVDCIPLQLWGAISALAMAAMALGGVYDPVCQLLDIITNRQTSLKLLSRAMNIFIMLYSLVVCVLGTTPNDQQSRLAGFPLWMIGFAAAASFALEFPAFYMITGQRGLPRVLTCGLKLKGNGTDTYSAVERDALNVDSTLAALRDGERPAEPRDHTPRYRQFLQHFTLFQTTGTTDETPYDAADVTAHSHALGAGSKVTPTV